MPLTLEQRKEKLRLQIAIKEKEIAAKRQEAPKEEKRSLLQKTGDIIGGAAKSTGEFFSEYAKEPVAATGGMLTGGAEAVGEIGAALTPKPTEAELTRKPSTRPATDTSALTSLDVRGGAYRPQKKTDARPDPMTPGEKKAFEKTKPVGGFLTKAALGGGAASIVAPAAAGAGAAAKVGTLLAKGAAANVPFAASAFGEGGTEGLLKDVALNTAIDLATLGAGKAMPGIKKAIMKQASKAGKKITDIAADNMAKEAFGKAAKEAPTIKDVPMFKSKETLAKEVAAETAKKQPFGELAGDLKDIDAIIDKGISKGVKPDFPGKKDFKKRVGFNQKSNEAVKIISENKDKIKLTNDFGESIPYPKSAADMASAIDQAKKIVFDQYHTLTKEAGQEGAAFSMSGINKKLDGLIESKGKSPEIRRYAETLKKDLSELHGQPPKIIEERIAELNSSLAGFYEGRIVKGKAQVDASVANIMRDELDNIISNATGTQYAPLKAKYAALKTIEKDVNKRAVVNARRANKGLMDMTDIFTGGDIAAGLLTANPALLAKGTVGKGLKEVFKALNDPDRAIANMFKQTYEHVDKFNIKQMPKQKGTLGRMLGNESGKVLATESTKQTKSKNFKNWFGDWEKAPKKASKIVNDKGEPLVVYHGTANDFTDFSPKGKAKGHLLFGEGSYFTPNPKDAGGFARQTNQGGSQIGGNIKPVYLDMKNPIKDMEEFNKIRHKVGFMNSEGITKELKKRGYDGIALNRGKTTTASNDMVYVAFKPNQVKSSIGNSGKFSSLTNDITGKTSLSPVLPATAATAAGTLGVVGALDARNRKKDKKKLGTLGRHQ